MTDRASRIAEITEREAGLAHTVVPARYLMSAPPFTPTPGPEAELAQLRARVDALQAELSASEGRVKEARKAALEDAAKVIDASVSMARTIWLTGLAAQHWASSTPQFGPGGRDE